jgi:hypothetical protein
VQVASFLPCAIAFLLRQPDAIHAMSLPCLVGLILFVWGMVRLIAEVSRRRKSPEVGAEPGAPPNGGPAERFGNSGVGGGPPSVS